MNCSATPSPSQCPTKVVETPPPNIHVLQDNTIDVTPTKAIKDCTWSGISVSSEQTNPCVRKPEKQELLYHALALYPLGMLQPFLYHHLCHAMTLEMVDQIANSSIRFVTTCFLNVLFGEAMKPHLGYRGRVLI